MDDLIKLFGNVLDAQASYEHEKGWSEDGAGAKAAKQSRDAAIGDLLIALGAAPAQPTKRAVSA